MAGGHDRLTPEGRRFYAELEKLRSKRVFVGFQAGKVTDDRGVDMAQISRTRTDKARNIKDFKEKRPPESGLYPYNYPLQPQSAGYIRLHTGRAFLLHRLCNVSINIKGETRGSVSQIALNRLYIIPSADSCHGVRVP